MSALCIPYATYCIYWFIFHIYKKACIESIPEYELETSDARKSIYNNYVILIAPENLINDPSTTSMCKRSKIIDNAATMILSSFI